MSQSDGTITADSQEASSSANFPLVNHGFVANQPDVGEKGGVEPFPARRDIENVIFLRKISKQASY